MEDMVKHAKAFVMSLKFTFKTISQIELRISYSNACRIMLDFSHLLHSDTSLSFILTLWKRIEIFVTFKNVSYRKTQRIHHFQKFQRSLDILLHNSLDDINPLVPAVHQKVTHT